MAIKIKYRDPKFSDFSSKEIIINAEEGTLFYKSKNSLFKVQGDNTSTVDVPGEIDSEGGSSTAVYIFPFDLFIGSTDNPNTNQLFVPWSGTNAEDGAEPFSYLLNTFDGTLKKFNIYFEADPGTITVRIYTHNVPTFDESPGNMTLVETHTLNPGGASVLSTANCNASVTKDNFLLITLQTTNDMDNKHAAGNIVIEYDTST